MAIMSQYDWLSMLHVAEPANVRRLAAYVDLDVPSDPAHWHLFLNRLATMLADSELQFRKVG